MAAPLVAAGLIGAGAGLIGNILSNVTNMAQQKETNLMSMEQFNKQMDYTKATQAEQWRRDDTMLQRSVADAQSAGLSPITALGLSNTSTPVSQPAAPHLMAPHVDSIMSGVNLDSAIDALIQSKKLDLDEKKYLTDDENKDLDREALLSIEADKIEAQTNNIKAQIQSNEKIESNKLLQRVIEFNDTIALALRTQDHKEKMEYQSLIMNQINTFSAHAYKATGGRSSNFKVFDSQVACDAYNTWWSKRYNDFLATELNEPDSTSFSKSHGFNMGANAGANIGGSSGMSDSVTGAGSASRSGSGLAGANAGYNTGSFDSYSNAQNWTTLNASKFAKFLAEYPYGVYKPSKAW